MKIKLVCYTLLMVCGVVCGRTATEARLVAQHIDRVMQSGDIDIQKWDKLMSYVRDYVLREYNKLDKARSNFKPHSGRDVFSESVAFEQFNKISAAGRDAVGHFTQIQNRKKRFLLYDSSLDLLQADLRELTQLQQELESALSETQDLHSKYSGKHDVAEILLKLVTSVYNAVVPVETTTSE